jgi:TolB-like protein
MMANKEKLRERFLRDPLPRRLGGLAATLGRISSVARKSSDPANVARLLEEAKYLIEWTAADAEPEVAAELVSMQTLINLWGKAWEQDSQNKAQRTLLSVQAKHWSDLAMDFSGLI